MPFDGTSYVSETTRILMAGRERVRAGWCQGTGRTYGGGVCMVFALDFSKRPEAEEATTFLKRATGAYHLPTWNDTHTKEEVLAGYDRAIDLSLGLA